MTARDVAVLSAATVLTLAAGVWLARRTRAGPGESPLAPLGFSWNVQRGAYTKMNNQGELEVYAQGVYL